MWLIWKSICCSISLALQHVVGQTGGCGYILFKWKRDICPHSTAMLSDHTADHKIVSISALAAKVWLFFYFFLLPYFSVFFPGAATTKPHDSLVMLRQKPHQNYLLKLNKAHTWNFYGGVTQGLQNTWRGLNLIWLLCYKISHICEGERFRRGKVRWLTPPGEDCRQTSDCHPV